jgi:beta-phosphoglucomutase
MGNFRAVLFDFDGVIGKTLEDNTRAWTLACRELGVPFDPEEFLLAEGMKSAEFASRLLARHGREVAEVETLIDRKNELYRSHNRFSIYPGVEKLVKRLRDSGVKVGVVSGGGRERLLSGRAGDLLRSCDTVVTGDELTHGKPNPEAYQRAAEALKVSPAECLVVENAPLGIQSAKSAGMSCIGICSTLSGDHLRRADRVVADHAELVKVLDAASLTRGVVTDREP